MMKARNRNLDYRRILAGVAVVTLAQSAYGAVATWKNASAATTDWNTGTNWTGGTGTLGVPGTADVATFDTVKSKSPNLSSSATIVEVNFSNSSSSREYDITATNSSTLTLTGTTALNAINVSGTNTFDVPLIFGAASGTQLISIGNGASASNTSVMTFGTGTGGGGITINSGLVLNLAFTATSTVLANYATVNLNSAIGSTGAITLGLGSTGIGSINLSGTNNYTGITNVGSGGANQGVITIANNSVFGTSAVNFSGNVQASADLSGANAIGNNATINAAALFQGANNIELGGTVNGNGRTITNNISSGILKISGNVSIFGTDTANKTFAVNGSGNATISGIIDDNAAGTHTNAGALSYSGAGTLTLSGANKYTGATTISSGTISVSSLNSVVGGSSSSSLGAPTTATNGRINFGATGPTTGTLLYTGAGETTDRVIRLVGNGVIQHDDGGSGALVFSSNVLAAQGAPVTLTLQGSSTANNTIGGIIPNASVTNTTSVIKAGAGTWTLSGGNTYTGTTAVNEGKLLVDGSLAAGSSVTVGALGTLGGHGTINGPVSVTGGHLAPGNSVGTLANTSATAMSVGASAVYDYEIGGSTASPTNDLIDLTNVSSSVSFGGAWTLNISNLGTVNPTDKTFVLFDYIGSDPVNLGIPTLNFVGAGTAGWTGGNVSIDSANTRIILSNVAIPEPASLSLLTLGGLGLLARRHRRNRTV